MTAHLSKIGIIVTSWNEIQADNALLENFISSLRGIDDGGIIILSSENTKALTTCFRKFFRKSFVADRRILSAARLSRLCDQVFHFDGQRLLPIRHVVSAPVTSASRLGLVLSNGYGLGHVARMEAFAKYLASFSRISFLSFSAGKWRDAFYLPSQQYLQLPEAAGDAYCYESVRLYFSQENPTHVIYDGNILPNGLLRALSERPDIYLAWIRGGMWPPQISKTFIAQQALVDLVIEPGELAQAYDPGPTWQQRMEFCPPSAFLKTLPIRSTQVKLSRAEACRGLGLDARKGHALLMLGAIQKSDDMVVLRDAVQAVLRVPGLVPVVAHWPMAHHAPPVVDGAVVIERMPIEPYYNAFDLIVSAAGYNSFHELLDTDRPLVFTPQELESSDLQLLRATWAADYGHALLCRRNAMAALDRLVACVPSRTRVQGWFDDWQGLADTMGLRGPDREAQGQSGVCVSFRQAFMQIYTRFTARHGAGDTRFVMALDMSGDAFQAKYAALSITEAPSIIVTNSVDPVILRRAGLKYLWINEKALCHPWARARQITAWLRIWRPLEIIDL